MISIRNQEDYLQNNTIQQFEIDDGKKYSFNYPCKNYSVCHPFEITFPPGFYFLDVYGASGTTLFLSGQQYDGGHGGHSSGVFIARKRQKLYLYIGASQNLTFSDEILDNSFNGGLRGGFSAWDGIGGGATDFRTKGGEWYSNPESRILVAGGGGSGRMPGRNAEGYKGGDGGGSEGKPGPGYYCSSAYGTQTESKYPTCQNSSVGHSNGRFGYGAGGGWAGGGGGYYGGGWVDSGAGGGGSGYIGGVESIGKYKAITETSLHSGFGYAEITILSSLSFMNKFLNTCHSSFLSRIPSYYLFISLYLS